MQLDDSMHAFGVKQVECNRLPHQGSDDIKDHAVPFLVNYATAKEMVKLKWLITAKNRLSKSMLAKLGATLQEIEETKKTLTTTG